MSYSPVASCRLRFSSGVLVIVTTCPNPTAPGAFPDGSISIDGPLGSCGEWTPAEWSSIAKAARHLTEEWNAADTVVRAVADEVGVEVRYDPQLDSEEPGIIELWGCERFDVQPKTALAALTVEEWDRIQAAVAVVFGPDGR